MRQTPRIIDVPADPDRAQLILAALYEAGEDDVISASFAAFAAVLDGVEGALDAAYMAEINRGLNHAAFDKQRVRRGIEVLRTAATSRRIEPLSAGYCEANARLALGEHALAIEGYSGILPQLEQLNAHIAAMCAKNLGSAYEALGDVSSAHQFYARAVELDSELGEAHFALAMCARRDGDIQMALSHLDRVAPSPRSAIRMPSVSGWRIALLFQTGDYNAAFRDISTLRDQARSARWIWPWCARQVAIYGRATVDSTKLALRFWNGYLEEHPDVAPAKRERLLCLARLDRHSVATRVSFDAFVAEVSEVAAAGDSQAALLWDVAGHWAQREGRWDDAEAAFRRAHELDSSRFAYCLATALNFLDRYDEALRVLNALPLVDMDAQAWFQLAVARDGIGNLEGAIAAYRLAIGLEPAYALAWFNLGGVLFNAGDLVSAREIWTDALNRFPEHELAATIRNEFAFVVGDGH
ncbi:MAG: tetratricopeptide repeat protein [Gemmatimonadota bacterium]